MLRRTTLVALPLAAALLLAACAEPPTAEMDRAQGAIDAARAAGAEQYAASEYTAATGALTSAHEAVAAGDYRLALNHALESRDLALNAARQTADTKARMRAEVERAVTDVTALVADGEARVTAARRAGTARRLLAPPTDAIGAARAALQKAGTAVAAGDYIAAHAALDGVKEATEKSLATLDASRRSPSPRRPR
jgi:hypothetical protein